MWNNEWIKGVDYPEWGDNEVYKKTIGGSYLLPGESPAEAYMRVCKTVSMRLGRPELTETFYEYVWKGWLCLASPVLSNTGTERGLPISCFGIDVGDSIYEIGNKNLEMMLLAKHGGGVGIGVNMIRPAGSKIKQNGTSDGVVPFCKIYDSTILATNQGAVRRGAASVNINIDHDDFEEWLEIREPKGDINRQSLNLHQCATCCARLGCCPASQGIRKQIHKSAAHLFSNELCRRLKIRCGAEVLALGVRILTLRDQCLDVWCCGVVGNYNGRKQQHRNRVSE